MAAERGDRRWFSGFATIRARLTAAACLVVAVALVVGAFVILAVLKTSLIENLDDAAIERAEEVAKDVGEGGALGTLQTHGDEDAFVQVITQDGTIMAASQNLQDIGPIADFRPTRPGAEVRTNFIPVPDELQDEFRSAFAVLIRLYRWYCSGLNSTELPR